MSRPLWARELKRISILHNGLLYSLSRPLWARELKQTVRFIDEAALMSRPLWARELKPFATKSAIITFLVAPLVGA